MANLITGYTILTNTANGYAAPEQLYVSLADGECESRGRLSTGWIISINGNVVQTLSGSTYELGTPSEGSEVASIEGAVVAVRKALGRLQGGEAIGYSPATLHWLLSRFRAEVLID